MRFSRWLVFISLIALLPQLSLAEDNSSCTPIEIELGVCADTDSTSEEETTGTGTSTNPSSTSGVQFDPRGNIIGNPTDPDSFSTGTVKQLTFLSGGSDPLSIMLNIVNVALSFLGIISLIMLLYAGLKWFTARDNEEQAKEAKDIITGAVVGLVITLGSLGIAQLVFSLLQTSTEVDVSLVPFVSVAYAAEPNYNNPEALPFDAWAGSYSDNDLIQDGGVASILDFDLGRSDPLSFTINIINIVLTLLGLAFLMMMIYAGILWVTARGNDEQITKAKDTIKRAVFGLIIVLAAYGTSWFIFYIISAFTYGESFLQPTA